MSRTDCIMAGFDVNKFHKFLRSSYLGRKIVYSKVTGSTMDDARRLAHDVTSHPHGTVFISEQQTKARGARDHKWNASNMGNIYMSIILHLMPSYKTFDGRFDLEVAACLAVLHVVQKYGITWAKCKWPNDVWVRGHKLAGFLVEDGQFDIPGTAKCSLILGAGINVNADVRRSSQLKTIATSMICERAGVYVQREKFLAEVCLHMEQTLANSREANLAAFMKENLFQENSDLVISRNAQDGKTFDAKFLTICNNWDIQFIDTETGIMHQGSSVEYTVRPKVVNKILVVFVQDNNNVASFSDWLSSVIDLSRYVVCMVPESAITMTDEWMKSCSLLVLLEYTSELALMTSKLELFLGSGGKLLTFGMATVYVSNSLQLPLKESSTCQDRESLSESSTCQGRETLTESTCQDRESLRESSTSQDTVLVHLLTECDLSSTSSTISNSTTPVCVTSVNDMTPVSITHKADRSMLPSYKTCETVLFLVKPVCFHFHLADVISVISTLRSNDGMFSMSTNRLLSVNVTDTGSSIQTSVASGQQSSDSNCQQSSVSSGQQSSDSNCQQSSVSSGQQSSVSSGQQSLDSSGHGVPVTAYYTDTDTSNKDYYTDTGNEDLSLAGFVAILNCGSRVALWGFDIAVMGGTEMGDDVVGGTEASSLLMQDAAIGESEKSNLSAEDRKALSEDRFKRDEFMLQVLNNLLEN